MKLDYEILQTIETIYRAIYEGKANYTLEEADDYIIENCENEDFGFSINNELPAKGGRTVKYSLLKR